MKNYILKSIKSLKYISKQSSLPEKFLHKNVPYFSQWESPNLNKQIIEKTMDVKDDPNWLNSGAKTKEEYASWSWSGCGMACTKMILAYRTGKIASLVGLGKTCMQYGGYASPLETSHGLIYKPYLTFVKKEFGWNAKIISHSSSPELMHELAKNNDVIISVSPRIRNPSSRPKTKGGHLVLLVGYDRGKKEFYFHNPSGISPKTQEYAAISFADFKKFFSGRGIVIQK